MPKRRAIPNRNYLGCRDLQAAIPELRDALPTQVLPATGHVANPRSAHLPQVFEIKGVTKEVFYCVRYIN